MEIAIYNSGSPCYEIIHVVVSSNPDYSRREPPLRKLNTMAKQRPRKKLPKELAVINADNCTGCESCLEVCLVDCIMLIIRDRGVKGVQSWCEIDLE